MGCVRTLHFTPSPRKHWLARRSTPSLVLSRLHISLRQGRVTHSLNGYSGRNVRYRMDVFIPSMNAFLVFIQRKKTFVNFSIKNVYLSLPSNNGTHCKFFMIVDLPEGGKIRKIQKEGGCHTDRKWLLERNNSVRRQSKLFIFYPVGLVFPLRRHLLYTLGKVDYKINGDGQFNFSLHYVF